MKKLLIFLVLLPFSVAAQDTLPNEQNDKQINIKFERLNMQHDNTILKKDDHGDLEIAANNIHVSGPVYIDLHDKTHPATTDAWIIVARHVVISATSNPVSLKANVFHYNDKTKTGSLTGNIIAIENGAEKKIGERAEMDFNNDEYKIVSIK